jgi:hypothetical protein
MQKKMETTDEAATQMIVDLYKKSTCNQQTPIKTIIMNKDKTSDKEKVGKPASYSRVQGLERRFQFQLFQIFVFTGNIGILGNIGFGYGSIERHIIIKHNTIITGDLYLASVKALKLLNNTITNHQTVCRDLLWHFSAVTLP